jgi:cadmium resistance transport/sequestration family protein
VPVAETAATAVVAFVATNIDDIVVLSVLFASRDDHFRTRDIVAGQYLGFAVLVAASLAASAGLRALPDEAVGVLGLIPIALGVRGLSRARRLDDNDDEATSPTTMTTTAVASITVANGADNIAVYAPLFATFGTGGITATLLVFFALVAVWCLAGLLIGSRPAVIRIVEWAGRYAIPVVLIALGIFILAESGLPQTLLG